MAHEPTVSLTVTDSAARASELDYTVTAIIKRQSISDMVHMIINECGMILYDSKMKYVIQLCYSVCSSQCYVDYIYVKGVIH